MGSRGHMLVTRVFWSGIPDPGSGIPDPGSGIPDPESGIPYHGSWIPDPGSRIRDFEKIKIGIQNLNLENPRPGAGLLFFLTLNIFDFKTEEPSGGADPESKAVSEVQGLVTDTMRKSRHGVGSGIGARIRDLRPGPRSMMRSWMRDPRLGLGSGTGSTGQGTSRIRCLIPDVGHGGGHDETSFNLYAGQGRKPTSLIQKIDLVSAARLSARGKRKEAPVLGWRVGSWWLAICGVSSSMAGPYCGFRNN